MAQYNGQGPSAFRPVRGVRNKAHNQVQKLGVGSPYRLFMAVDCNNTKPGIEMASLTDVGRQRANNEDSYLYWEPIPTRSSVAKGALPSLPTGWADTKVGRRPVGLRLRPCATSTTAALATTRKPPSSRLSTPLTRTFTATPWSIRSFTGWGPPARHFRSSGHKLFFAHVGDSRLYLVRAANVSRLTRDHSYVGRLVESGIVRSEDAESHPQRHILTAALGSGREVIPDSPPTPVMLEEGDSLVLCTDGLWSLVGEQDLGSVVRAHTPAEACVKLVNMALERGGPDNITLLVLRVSA